METLLPLLVIRLVLDYVNDNKTMTYGTKHDWWFGRLDSVNLPPWELTLEPERHFVVIRSGSRRGHFVDKYLYGYQVFPHIVKLQRLTFMLTCLYFAFADPNPMSLH
jgi:hypothetical protein